MATLLSKYITALNEIKKLKAENKKLKSESDDWRKIAEKLKGELNERQ